MNPRVNADKKYTSTGIAKAFRAPQSARQSVHPKEVRFMMARLQGEHQNGFTCKDLENAIIFLGFTAEAMEAREFGQRKAVA